jgi:hypothetical protein
MRRKGSQRQYECLLEDFPIRLEIEAKGMRVFQGVLSDAEVRDPATGQRIATYDMPVGIDGLVGTSAVRSPDDPPTYDPDADVFIAFTGFFATAESDSPEYVITMRASSGDVEVTRAKRLGDGHALARLVFLYRESE